MVALEREQMNVDRQASELERKLRHVMGKGDVCGVVWCAARNTVFFGDC